MGKGNDMSDLISKNEAVKIAKGFTFTFAEERQRYMDFLEYCLNNAPAVDVKSVVHGVWIEQYGNLGKLYTEFVCSKCKMIYENTHHYCPNCGARMDGE